MIKFSKCLILSSINKYQGNLFSHNIIINNFIFCFKSKNFSKSQRRLIILQPKSDRRTLRSKLYKNIKNLNQYNNQPISQTQKLEENQFQKLEENELLLGIPVRRINPFFKDVEKIDRHKGNKGSRGIHKEKKKSKIFLVSKMKSENKISLVEEDIVEIPETVMPKLLTSNTPTTKIRIRGTDKSQETGSSSNK